MARLSYITDPPATYGTLDEFERVLLRLREIGYEAAEFSLPYPYGFEPADLRAVCVRTGMQISALLTGWSYFHEGLALSSPDADIRQRATARLIGHLDSAAQLQTQLVVGQIQGFLSDEPDPQIANDRIANCLTQVAAAAKVHGVNLVMEPVNHLQVGFNTTVAEVRAMVARIGSPRLRPMVDTLHMNIEERSLEGPICELGRELGHVHLCEANGGVFGSGHMDFASVLSTLAEVGYDGFVAIKVYRNATWEFGARTAYDLLSLLQGAGEVPVS